MTSSQHFGIPTVAMSQYILSDFFVFILYPYTNNFEHMHLGAYQLICISTLRGAKSVNDFIVRNLVCFSKPGLPSLSNKAFIFPPNSSFPGPSSFASRWFPTVQYVRGPT